MNELAEKIHANAKSKGFYNSPYNYAEKVMLVVCELSESIEADRAAKNADIPGLEKRLNELMESTQWDLVKPENVEQVKNEYFNQCFKIFVKDSKADELADAIIRILDVCAFLKIDIDKHIELKNKYNSTRPFMHGKSY